jgi:LmbE family N-acetylglucosaminyl deacetylase
MADEHPIGIPERAIALFAHPDDPEFLAGGTIAQWTDAGCEVSYVIMTDGRAGDMGLRDDPKPISEAELVARRQQEQRAAGAVLGVRDIVFLDHHDGELMHTLELRRQLVREIRKRKPQAALLFDPQRRVMPGYVQHPDHWTSGEAALAALFPLAGSPRAFPELRDEGLEAHSVPDLYLVAAVDPNYQVDITATIERKIAAMRCHTSQVADPERVETMMKGMAQAAAGGTGYAYAEAFHFIRMGARDLLLALK